MSKPLDFRDAGPRACTKTTTQTPRELVLAKSGSLAKEKRGRSVLHTREHPGATRQPEHANARRRSVCAYNLRETEWRKRATGM